MLAIESYAGLGVVRPVVVGVIVACLTERGNLDAAEAAARSYDREQAADTPTWQQLLLGIVDLKLAKGQGACAVDEGAVVSRLREGSWDAGPSVGLI